MDPVRALRNTMGGICDPNTAWMLLRSLETLELRMQRAAENAVKVCDFLKDHPKVEGVGYLGLLEDGAPEGHLPPPLHRRRAAPSRCSSRAARRRASASSTRCKIAKLAVSLGGTETLASHPAAMTHLSVPDERKAALGITDNLVRISIGIEDADDLIADFEQALAAV